MPSSGTKAAEGEDATALKIGRDSKPPIGNLFVSKNWRGEYACNILFLACARSEAPPFTTTAKAMTAEWGCIQSVTQTLKRYRGWSAWIGIGPTSRPPRDRRRFVELGWMAGRSLEAWDGGPLAGPTAASTVEALSSPLEEQQERMGWSCRWPVAGGGEEDAASSLTGWCNYFLEEEEKDAWYLATYLCLNNLTVPSSTQPPACPRHKETLNQPFSN